MDVEQLDDDQRGAKLTLISRALAKAMAPSDSYSLALQARDVAYACDTVARELSYLSVHFEHRGTQGADVESVMDGLEEIAVSIVQLRNSLASHIK